jgi:hypothetical protein
VEQWIKEEGLSKSEEKAISKDPIKRGVLNALDLQVNYILCLLEFLDWIKDNLGSVRVTDIKASGKQSEHPFMVLITYHK